MLEFVPRGICIPKEVNVLTKKKKKMSFNNGNFQAEDPMSIGKMLYPDYVSFPIRSTDYVKEMLSEIRLNKVGTRPSSLKQGWQK